MPRLARPELHGGLSGEKSRVRVTFNDPRVLDKVITTYQHTKTNFRAMFPDEDDINLRSTVRQDNISDAQGESAQSPKCQDSDLLR